MTALLLLLGAVLLLSIGLYLVLCKEHVVAAWWYRLFHDPEPTSAAKALPPVDIPLPYERARLLDEVGPCIVAGSDLDRAHIDIRLVNKRLSEMVAADEELAGLSALDLSAYYVLPEPSPEVRR